MLGRDTPQSFTKFCVDLTDNLRKSGKTFILQGFPENHLRCYFELIGEKSFELAIVSAFSISEKYYN